VNLALHITGKLGNGYHILDSLIGFPNYGDILTFEKASEITLKISGPFANDLKASSFKNNENIIVKAARLMCKTDQGVKINLLKNLPVSSGIGGGSTDAAVTLQAISEIWNIPLPGIQDLISLGADIPVCLSQDFQRMEGVGEKLTALSKPSKIWIVLVNSGLKISTKAIFDQLEQTDNKPLDELTKFETQDSFFNYLSSQRNDLEIVVTKLFPQVGNTLEILRKTKGNKLVRMSGSGSTCFGLYLSEREAILAVSFLKTKVSDYWIQAVPIF
jgi:4-diphosphocytidyl-2-C-methyl-D-erythritol kinase